MHIDVTERREAENALRETDKRKDEFLAILGHELRNPLVAIRSSVAVHEADADGVDPVWTVVARQSRHMMRLVNDLLDIMRIDRGKLTLQQSTIDLLDCVRDVASAVEPICRSAGISLDVDLPSEPLYVYADSERLVQILDNLLRNAVSYTDRGGRIRVLGHRRGGDAVISVRDTGIGMEPDEIERLFEPYRQVDPGRRSGGLGLGLTLVRRLAELHGGAVIARSDGIGKGSEFAFRLPLMAGAEHSTEAAALPRPPRRRVLVVDDDTDVADMFAILLETLDQDVRVAYAGEAALQAAREHRPEVAFLDLSMPDMGGDELARRLREQAQPGPYIVALSGFGIDTRKASSNFDNHLLKPAAIEKIVEMLSSLGE
jgi:two-component system CheB/CheR fusion protein